MTEIQVHQTQEHATVSALRMTISASFSHQRNITRAPVIQADSDVLSRKEQQAAMVYSAIL